MHDEQTLGTVMLPGTMKNMKKLQLLTCLLIAMALFSGIGEREPQGPLQNY
jgi:hypothetical protein